MLPMFKTAPAASAAPAAPAAPAASAASPAPLKKHDEATNCRIKKYESYRKTCSDEEKKVKGSCAMVSKCAKHGVGSELWPVDVWHLDNDKFAAVNEKYKDPANPKLRAVDVGKRCMNEVMRGDEKFVKEIETECGPLEKKPVAVAPASKKPVAVAPASKKPVAIKSASKKPVAVAPASKKPVASPVKK